MKRLLLLLFVATAGSISSKAQIVFHDIMPDSSCSGASSGFYSMKPVAGGPELVVRYYPSPSSVSAEQHGSLEMLFQGGYPAKLNANDNISATASSWTMAALALNSESNGNWQSEAIDKHIGFRFKISGNWHYGWLKMTVSPGGKGFTAKEWAYNSVAGQPIAAGQKNTTGIGNVPGDKGIGLLMTGRHIGFSNLQQGQKYRVTFTGMDGRCMLQSGIQADDKLSVAELASGIYAIRLHNGKEQYAFKVFVP